MDKIIVVKQDNLKAILGDNLKLTFHHMKLKNFIIRVKNTYNVNSCNYYIFYIVTHKMLDMIFSYPLQS